MDEFVPLEHFYRFLRYWWIAVLTTLLGGLFGLAFSYFHTPIYEAQARVSANVDLTRVTKLPLEHQEEDLALFNVQVAMLDPQTINNVIQAASRQNIVLDPTQLLKNQTIERKLAFWDLHYRDENPSKAQTVANLWIEEAYKTLLVMKDSGKIPSYVIIQGVTPADTPQTPIYYQFTWLILAGGIIGLVSGILIIEAMGSNYRVAIEPYS
jgi:uncharacterized protein involved in exopolysaccharide biosynthesis